MNLMSRSTETAVWSTFKKMPDKLSKIPGKWKKDFHLVVTSRCFFVTEMLLCVFLDTLFALVISDFFIFNLFRMLEDSKYVLYRPKTL